MSAKKHELLETILEYTPKLRAAGIPQVSIEGATWLIGPLPEAPDTRTTKDEDDDLPPLDDPATFGVYKKPKRKGDS